jgi:uncharacterized protein
MSPKDALPSRETCLALMDRYEMLPQIKAHSHQVARVALTLGKHLLPQFPSIDLALVEAGGMLHDIAKTECLRTKGNHVEVGAEMLKTMGFDRLVPIVAQHVRLADSYYLDGTIDEAVLVHYADKRVRHEAIVDLRTRFDYLVTTYGRSPEIIERIETLFQDTLKLESRLFIHLPFSPQALEDHLS